MAQVKAYKNADRAIVGGKDYEDVPSVGSSRREDNDERPDEIMEHDKREWDRSEYSSYRPLRIYKQGLDTDRCSKIEN